MQITEELKEIRKNLKSPDERFGAWENLLTSLFVLEQEMLDYTILNEPPLPKHIDNEEQIKALTDAIERFDSKNTEYCNKINEFSERFSSVISRLRKSTEALHGYSYLLNYIFIAKEMYSQDLEEIKEKVIEEAGKVYLRAIELNIQDSEVEKYIKDSKSMITVFLFQSPHHTSSIPEERQILTNVYSKWDASKYVILCCEKINELFKNYKHVS